MEPHAYKFMLTLHPWPWKEQFAKKNLHARSSYSLSAVLSTVWHGLHHLSPTISKMKVSLKNGCHFNTFLFPALSRFLASHTDAWTTWVRFKHQYLANFRKRSLEKVLCRLLLPLRQMEQLLWTSAVATDEFTLELIESLVRLIQKLKGTFNALVFHVLGMRPGSSFRRRKTVFFCTLWRQGSSSVHIASIKTLCIPRLIDHVVITGVWRLHSTLMLKG